MATTVIKTVFQFRRATTDEWEIVNPILREGEPAYDITAKKHKIGDGKSKWTDLHYQEGTGSADKIDWENILNAPTKLSQFENDIDIPDASYIDEKLDQKADRNHNHDGVYQPIGDYLTEETDPTVPAWAKQAEKPTYTYAEIENTPDLTLYATTEYVDDEIEKAKQGFEKYDDTEIKNRIAANEETIKSLSGDGAGSVKETVANAIAEVINGAPEDFDTLKEVADWIKNDTTGAAKIQNDINELNKKTPFIEELEHRAVLDRVEIGNVPTGTLVNYYQDEVRVMAPSDTTWTANRENKYYMSVKLFAPSNAKYFKESLDKQITVETEYEFEGNDFAGIDEHGCKYSLVWLPIAELKDETWSYLGVLSAIDKGFIGWYWHADWYDENHELIGSDIIRINLSNESCHSFEQPYYMTKYATKDSIKNPLNISGATSGQIVKIKTVDPDGVPIEWEAMDIPSGSGLSRVESVNGKTGVVELKASDVINTSEESNKVSVASDGTLEINSITADKIIQNENSKIVFESDELIILGGNADG